MSARPSQKMRVLSLAMHVVLILGLLIGAGSKLAWLAVLPLLPSLPGLYRGRRYTYAWTSMLLVFYCAVLLSNGYTMPGARTLMFALATVSAIEFAALVLFVRFNAREAAWDAQQNA